MKMKTFKVRADINGSMFFEVKAENQAEAQKQVDELLSDTTVKQALEKYKDSMELDTKIKEVKEERQEDLKMPYQKRIPPVKVDLSIERFNYLIEMLTRYATTEDEKMVALATKLKEKLLRYSIPRTTEEQETFVDVRFYPNEASEMIYMLLANTEDIQVDTNYYEVLLKVREKLKEDKQVNEQFWKIKKDKEVGKWQIN